MDHKRSDSGYSSIGSSEFLEVLKNFNFESLAEFSKKKEVKEEKIDELFYEMIDNLNDDQENWENHILNFKEKVKEIQDSFLSNFASITGINKTAFSWRDIDDAVFRLQKLNNGEGERIGDALRKVAQTNAALEDKFLSEMVIEYSRDYWIPEKEILKSRNSQGCNLLHCLAITITEKAKFAILLKKNWKVYKYLAEKDLELAGEQNNAGETALDIIESEGITIDQIVVNIPN